MLERFNAIFLPIVLGIFTLISLVVTPADVHAQAGPTGSITVCKLITDPNGNVFAGPTETTLNIPAITPQVTSEVPAIAQIPDSTFTTPLTFNADLVGKDGIDDSQCTTYSNLAIGSYYYGQETINPSTNWKAPRYNDQFTVNVFSLSDFFTYDSNLFDGDPSNDASRNFNSDGHIVLDNGRPDRTLVILNQQQSGPNVGEGPNIGTGDPSTGGTSTDSQCPTDRPQKVDQVWFSDILPSEATVNWANRGDAWGYHIAYGPAQNNLIWGVEINNSKANSYTLKGLPDGNLWVAVVAKSSSDCGGPTSDTKQVGNGQVLGTSTLAQTGSLNSMVLLLSGAALISAGLWNTQNALKKGKKSA